VIAVIKEWIRVGKPLSGAVDHDMHVWARSLDWISTNLFDLPPLLDGHAEIQERVSNPYMDWLRSVCVALSTGMYTASDIAEAGVPWPSGHEPAGNLKMAVGRIMKKLFKETDFITIDNYRVERVNASWYDEKQQKHVPTKKYVIEDSENPSEY